MWNPTRAYAFLFEKWNLCAQVFVLNVGDFIDTDTFGFYPCWALPPHTTIVLVVWLVHTPFSMSFRCGSMLFGFVLFFFLVLFFCARLNGIGCNTHSMRDANGKHVCQLIVHNRCCVVYRTIFHFNNCLAARGLCIELFQLLSYSPFGNELLRGCFVGRKILQLQYFLLISSFLLILCS